MTLKRYAVFIFDKYYPHGGMNDFRLSFDTVMEAKEFVKNHEDTRDSWNDSCDFYQWQIYDMIDMKIVANHQFSDDYHAQKEKEDKEFRGI